MIRMLGSWGLAVLLLVPANVGSTQEAAISVIFVNGIGNTVEAAESSRRRMEQELTETQLHAGAGRRRFTVELVWNPAGWSGEETAPEALPRDVTELYLLKTSEELFGGDFQELVVPHDQVAALRAETALSVTPYINQMVPSQAVVATTTEVQQDGLRATKTAVLALVARVKRIGAAVVVAHSQGNLLANLAWAKLVSERGSQANAAMRVVNVANTSAYSVHGLNLTHAGDAALFSAATKLGAPDVSLEVLPETLLVSRNTPRGWNCATRGRCPFLLSPPTFLKPIDFMGALDHGLAEVYLSTVQVQESATSGLNVNFTFGASRFVDRFVDLVYAAVDSLQRAAPAAVGVPVPALTSGSFPGRQDIEVTAANATRIFCAVRSTADGSEPAEPAEPTETQNDSCGSAGSNAPTPAPSSASATFVLEPPTTGEKRVKVRFRALGNGFLGATSPTYRYTVSAPSPLVPGLPVATPSTGSFIGNQDIKLSAVNAQRIYCTLRSTTDGSVPPDPPEPSDALNDPCGLGTTPYVAGSSGAFALVAPVAGAKAVKARFRGWNAGVFGPSTAAHSFQVAAPAPTVPGVPAASPSGGSFPTGTTVFVSAAAAQRIYCTVRSTLDGSTPADPPEPTETLNDPCGTTSPNPIAGASGSFLLTAPASGVKRLKVRFRGWAAGVLGPSSAPYDYQSGAVTVVTPHVPSLQSPAESYVGTTALTVVANNAQRIYCAITSTADGSTPPLPPEPTETVNDACSNGSTRHAAGPSGTFELTAPDTGFKRVRVRFRAWNAGQYSDTSYPADLVVRSQPVRGTAVLVALGDLQGGEAYGKALALSADGRTAVGTGLTALGSEAAVWTVGAAVASIGEPPGGGHDATAYGVSSNGSTIVGGGRSERSGVSIEAFRWTAASGLQPLGGLTTGWITSVAWAVSADGATVVGESVDGGVSVPFRWTAATGMQGLGALDGPCPGCTGSARAVSDDGGTIVGASSGIAFRWTAAAGIQALPPLASDGPAIPAAWASGVSADGRIVVGSSYGAELPFRNPVAVMWTEGVVRVLGQVDGASRGDAKGVSADGAVVVGSAIVGDGWSGFVWTPGRGMRSIDELLRLEFGVNTLGWQFTDANAVSRDGRTIVGAGRNPDGVLVGWRVDLSAAPR